MTRSRALRVVTALALAGPATGVVLLAGVPAASAEVTNPGDGATYASEATRITIRAAHAASGSATVLELTAPGGGPVEVARAAADRFRGGELTYALSLDCWTFPSSSCTGRKPAPNGTWVITQSGGTTDRTTFVTRVAPEAPASVSAAARSPREVVVSWTRGAEPDLTGFAVFEGDTAVQGDVPLSACDAGRCSAVVSYDADRPGDHSYVVRAYRSVAPGSSETLASPASAPASASLTSTPASPPPASEPQPGSTEEPAGPTEPGSTAAPAPGSTSGPSSAPAPGSSAGPSTSGSTPSTGASTGSSSAAPSRSAAASTAIAQRRAFGAGFSAFGPKLGIPKLPPLPQSGAQLPSIAAPLPDGTFAPTLGFEDQVVQERIETLSPGQRITGVVSSAFDSERLARSTAGALVLLLAGAHLRRWLGSAPQD